MQPIIEAYAEELNAAPEAENINFMWERGLLCYGEAIEMLREAAENNRFNFIIQYQNNPGEKYRDYCDTLYTWDEVKKELVRLKEAAPGFSWRYRKELKP
jgi:hypothetical protein